VAKQSRGQPQDIQRKIWGEKGPHYPAPYDEVFAALSDSICDYYRTQMWDPWTAIHHRWYYTRIAGLRAWAKIEAGLWLPFKPSYTLKEYNQTVLAGRLRKHVGETLTDPGLMSFWINAAFEKGADELNAQLAHEMRLKPLEINVVTRAFCLVWDRHTPPLEFWEYSPMVAMFQYFLNEKGLSPTITEGSLRVLVNRLRLHKSSHTIVRWSPSEGPGILYFDVDAARAVGLPTGSDSE
jgi:hypothetical protein